MPFNEIITTSFIFRAELIQIVAYQQNQLLSQELKSKCFEKLFI